MKMPPGPGAKQLVEVVPLPETGKMLGEMVGAGGRWKFTVSSCPGKSEMPVASPRGYQVRGGHTSRAESCGLEVRPRLCHTWDGRLFPGSAGWACAWPPWAPGQSRVTRRAFKHSHFISV